MKRRPAPPSAAGYVLLFVLGILAVVSSLALGVAINLRLDAQLLGHQKTALQEHYLLHAAARLTALQLGLTTLADAQRTAGAATAADDAVRRGLWRPSPAPLTATVEGTAVQVQLQDASGLPDANLLTQPEWERLFMLQGADAARAQVLATRVLELRQLLVRTRGGAGFASLQELLDWPELPAAMKNNRADSALPGLGEWLVVGTANRRVNLDTTPLALLQVLGTVGDEQLQRLARLRAAGPLSAQQAQQWLQATGLVAYPPGAPPTVVRARLWVASPAPHASALVVVLSNQNGRFVVADQWVDHGLYQR